MKLKVHEARAAFGGKMFRVKSPMVGKSAIFSDVHGTLEQARLYTG